MSGNDTPQDKWILEHKVNDTLAKEIETYILKTGIELEKLDFGAVKYSVNEIGTIIDSDCMSKEIKEVAKYLILRENCKLYTKWDDKGSLIF